MNNSFEFIDVVRTTQHIGSRVDYTPNISVHSWGVNPNDMIPANFSNVTWRAYNPICSFHLFFLRSNHERLRLKRIESKCICFEELLARIHQYVCDDVVDNACSPANHALGDALSNDSDSDDGWIDTYDSN